MQSQAYAKINAFLKITGSRGFYHEMISRFIKLPQLYDTLTFSPKRESKHFILEGNFNCLTEQNTIYKAYKELLKASDKNKIENFFKVHKISVDKKIPSFAGLGGGSSDAATFLNMCNEHIDLKLDEETLAAIGGRVGADVPFFIYNYPVANVSGIGELIAPFEDEGLNFSTFTPDIACDTVAVFKAYRENFYNPISAKEKRFFSTLKTSEALDLYDASHANDLFNAAKSIYPDLASYEQANRFFSGSGSTFFSLEGK